MHTTKFSWMIDRLAPPPVTPAKPMRLRTVRARNGHGYTVETRHYTDGDVAMRKLECDWSGLEVVDDDHLAHLPQP